MLKNMKTEISYNFMPAEQHFNSPEELLNAVRHYQQTRSFVDGDERFNAPEVKFEKLLKEDGGFVLMPIARDYAFLYRGQGRFYNPCLPSLLRIARDSDHLFLDRMRIVEFELMLKQYPSVKYFEKERYEVDYVGLAQHYGLSTDVLDLTSDIRTAMFFAMCDYDRTGDCYHPKREDKEYIGYVYAYPVIGTVMNDRGMIDGGFLMHDLRVIGLQPFTRPGSQRGFSLHVDETKPFKAYLYSFSYTKRDSEAYYDEMINKRRVWDKDFIIEKTKLIRDAYVFTSDALTLATKRYGGKKTVAQMQKRMNALGIHFSGKVPWTLSDYEREKLARQFDAEQRIAINTQIEQRPSQMGETMSPITPLSFVGQQMVLQVIQGGEPCIDGYDSGIRFCLEDNPPVVGWSFDMNRLQTVPDHEGKVTAFDGVLKAPEAYSADALAKREVLRKKIKKATRPFRPLPWFVTNKGERLTDEVTFFNKHEEFASAVLSGDREKAEDLDEDLMEMAGKDGHIDLKKARRVSPRLLVWYMSNRAILKLQQGCVEEAAYCMNDSARIMHASGIEQDVFFMLDGLAQSRGQHDIFTSPFELACDYLMMAIMGQYFFLAISLSFLWKAKTLFTRLGYADVAQFVHGLIGLQCSRLAEAFKADDPEGASMFGQYAESLKGIELVVPDPETPRKMEWPKNPFGCHKDLTPEQRQMIYGPVHPRPETLEDEKMLSEHWPAFEYERSLLARFERMTASSGDNLPNILEVLDILCYEEEKYALRCMNTKLTSIILGDPHDSDGNLDMVVGEDGRYLFIPKGIINGIYYRGQSKFYDKCKPSLLRDKTEKDKFIERIKLCEFSILLQKHPATKVFIEGYEETLNDGHIENHEMYIDEEALAQHYGILTEFLDLTADKWVAAFFACTDYNHTPSGQRDNYVKHTDEDNGVLYIYQDIQEKKYSGELHPVGLQPFSRPVHQAGYVLKMEKGQNFNDLAHSIRFRFDSCCSSIIYWLFDQSMKIQPEETVEMKAKRIVEETSTFSRAAYELSHQRYFSELSDEDYWHMVDKYALKVQDAPLVDFTAEELELAKRNDFAIQNGSLMRRVMRNQIMTIEVPQDNPKANQPD